VKGVLQKIAEGSAFAPFLKGGKGDFSSKYSTNGEV
jgi:hypothetical protein